VKLIIAGGRNYTLTSRDYHRLTTLLRDHAITEVVSGACPTGADLCGEQWARAHEIPVKRFPADWARCGRVAGPMRNAAMAAYADALAVFPGGRGTESMLHEATSKGLTIFDFRG